METRVVLIGIIVDNADSVGELNEILHEAREYVVGRMGVPYAKRGVSIISVILDAPMNLINSVTGKLGMLSGVTAKTIYSKLPEDAARA